MAKKYYKQTAADIIRRLPLHHQLTASQTLLVKLTPTWQSWASLHLRQHHQNNQSSNKNHSSVTHFTDAHLVSANGGKLIVACANSACASRVKHLQQSLLETFRSRGYSEIEQIVVRIEHNLAHSIEQSGAEKHHAKSAEQSQATTNSETRNRVTSNNSLKAIQQCQKMVVNDQLAHSLKKLYKTLEDTRK